MHRVDLAEGPLAPAALADTPALELDASRVEFPAVEAALLALREVRGLRSLRLRSRLRALPTALTELRGLHRLELVDPELPGLPASLDRLDRLRALRLEMFHLGSLPRSVAGLTRLRELHIDAHHLCGLPEGLRALTELRALTLLLRWLYVHDWERPAHVAPRISQSVEALFDVLAGLPALAELTLGEPLSYGVARTFARLPPALGELHALERLTLIDAGSRVALPYGVTLPGVRELVLDCAVAATEDELRAMFPGAQLRGFQFNTGR